MVAGWRLPLIEVERGKAVKARGIAVVPGRARRDSSI